MLRGQRPIGSFWRSDLFFLLVLLRAYFGNLVSGTFNASDRRILAEPGRRGCCWVSEGDHPVRQTSSKVAGSLPFSSAKCAR